MTAGPLMSKHALWQIYGCMRNTAKLSKKISFFMHFHPPQTRQARWGRCVQRSLMMLWCDVQLIEIWLQKNVYPWQKQCFFIFLLFYRFMWGSNRIIYSISIQDVKANICLDVAPNCFTTTGKKTRKRNCTKVGKKKEDEALNWFHCMKGNSVIWFLVLFRGEEESITERRQ